MKRKEEQDERFSHDEMDNVPRVSGARDPPLVSVDDNLVTLDADRRLDVGSAVFVPTSLVAD